MKLLDANELPRGNAGIKAALDLFKGSKGRSRYAGMRETADSKPARRRLARGDQPSQAHNPAPPVLKVSFKKNKRKRRK